MIKTRIVMYTFVLHTRTQHTHTYTYTHIFIHNRGTAGTHAYKHAPSLLPSLFVLAIVVDHHDAVLSCSSSSNSLAVAIFSPPHYLDLYEFLSDHNLRPRRSTYPSFYLCA